MFREQRVLVEAQILVLKYFSINSPVPAALLAATFQAYSSCRAVYEATLYSRQAAATSADFKPPAIVRAPASLNLSIVAPASTSVFETDQSGASDSYGLARAVSEPVPSCALSTPEDSCKRCSRTDGRRWRCDRTALPGQRTCELHFRRGNANSDRGSRNSRAAKRKSSDSPASSNGDSQPHSGLSNSSESMTMCSVGAASEQFIFSIPSEENLYPFPLTSNPFTPSLTSLLGLIDVDNHCSLDDKMLRTFGM
jgi:hypothetical protein